MAKKATKSISEDGMTLTFTFHEEGVEPLSVDISELSDSIRDRLAMHGLSAKMGDSYAGVESVEECRNSAFRVWEDLRNGEWTARVAGTSGPRATQLALALIRVAANRGKELSLEQAVQALAAMPEEQKKQLRKTSEVRKAIQEIKMEQLEREAQRAEAEGEGDSSALNALFG